MDTDNPEVLALGVPDREHKQDEVRLYTAKTVLSYMDSEVYDLGPTQIEFRQNPVPVYGEDMKQLGYANVYMDATSGGIQRLMADVSIDAATEERLLAETQSVRLYARIFGVMGCAAMPLFDFQARVVPVRLRLDGVQLSRLKPTDERLAPFGALVT